MAFKIDTRRKDLVEEFRRNPIGQHSADLQLILNLFRGAPVAEKYVLVATEPHRIWALAQLPGRRGEPPRMLNRVFRSQAEAEWEVFKLRWEKYTGESLEN